MDYYSSIINRNTNIFDNSTEYTLEAYTTMILGIQHIGYPQQDRGLFSNVIIDGYCIDENSNIDIEKYKLIRIKNKMDSEDGDVIGIPKNSKVIIKLNTDDYDFDKKEFKKAILIYNNNISIIINEVAYMFELEFYIDRATLI